MSMRTALLAGLACAALSALTACGSDKNVAAADAAPVSEEVAEAGLDRAPLQIVAGSRTHRFTVEIARTDAQQQHGLMGRTEMAPGTGMIFPFSPPKIASFWMKDTLIPLDMVFIRADGSIDRIAENTIPESLEPVASGGEVAAVLELPGGTTAELGIDESARVTWTDPAK